MVFKLVFIFAFKPVFVYELGFIKLLLNDVLNVDDGVYDLLPNVTIGLPYDTERGLNWDCGDWGNRLNWWTRWYCG